MHLQMAFKQTSTPRGIGEVIAAEVHPWAALAGEALWAPITSLNSFVFHYILVRLYSLNYF